MFLQHIIYNAELVEDPYKLLFILLIFFLAKVIKKILILFNFYFSFEENNYFICL